MELIHDVFVRIALLLRSILLLTLFLDHLAVFFPSVVAPASLALTRTDYCWDCLILRAWITVANNYILAWLCRLHFGVKVSAQYTSAHIGLVNR